MKELNSFWSALGYALFVVVALGLNFALDVVVGLIRF